MPGRQRLTRTISTALAGVLAVVGVVLVIDRLRPSSAPVAGAPSLDRPADAPPVSEPAFVPIGRVVKEGVVVDFSLGHVDPEAARAGTFREGDDVIFRFELRDTAARSPLPNVYPAAWVVDRVAGTETPQKLAVKKVQTQINGGLFAPAELDLNVYYVLALNADATISVVDPLFSFGGSKLLAMIPLDSPGCDWTVTADEHELFVSMPESHQVAVIDTSVWEVIDRVDVPRYPNHLSLQPDGHYLWVARDDVERPEESGVSVVRASDHRLVAEIVTGPGPHEIAFADDSRFAFVTNESAGTVSVIDVRDLRNTATIETGARPVSVAFSAIAGMAYVSHAGDGSIVAIDGRRHRIAARMQAEPGMGQIRCAPDGRLAFAVNPTTDTVHIVDTAANRIVQTADVEDEPDQLAFSDDLAYVRHRGSENVLMIPLNQVGDPRARVPVVSFPAGQGAAGRTSIPSPADSIVQAPGANAVLVANAEDKSIYFYKEGMAAPMGMFKNYGHEPRAVTVVDRSLHERREAGVYTTVARLREPGSYDVAFFLDAPRIVHCFPIEIEPDPELARRRSEHHVDIEPAAERDAVAVGEAVRLRFAIRDHDSGRPRTGLTDAMILTSMTGGNWHQRHRAEEIDDGVYAIDFAPPRAGHFYAYFASAAVNVTFVNPHYLLVQATAGEPGPAKPEATETDTR